MAVSLFMCLPPKGIQADTGICVAAVQCSEFTKPVWLQTVCPPYHGDTHWFLLIISFSLRCPLLLQLTSQSSLITSPLLIPATEWSACPPLLAHSLGEQSPLSAFSIFQSRDDSCHRVGVEPLQLLKGCGTEAQVASSRFFLLQALVPVATLILGTGSLLAKLAGPGSVPMIASSRQPKGLFCVSGDTFTVTSGRNSLRSV